MRIEDLVKMDVEGDFRSDVQLSDYDHPTLNRDLLRNYIFTVHAPATFGAAQKDYAARDVLETLKTAFSVERAGSDLNRIVLTANYGRGKSHLALTLANFFSRPAKSDEVDIILGRLGQALNNDSQLAGYRDFKATKGEFLVIRLQGDAISDLQEGFINALEKALSEHEATSSIEIPLWVQPAEAWLKNLTGDMLQRAEAFLADENTDLPSLLSGLRRSSARELVDELFKHIHGAYPNFGREIALDQLVIWAVDDVCKPKGLGGVLILFDEFSLFLQKYIQGRAVGKLQQLLNGVSSRPGKVAFLAFSQQDVDTVAETYAQGQRRDDVRKELERLPKDKRARLFSLMEGVLDAYLRQDDVTWQVWYDGQQSVKSAFVQAREMVLEHFDKHYSYELQWNPQAYQAKVVKGCFPLHPLTTAILALHQFESGASENPRTALQFVRQTWQEVRHQPAQLADGSPNFVYAITLVDFYGEQLSKKWYAAYKSALESAPHALTEEQRKILQALLIQHAVGLKAQAGGQVGLLHELSGVEREAVKKALKELAAAKVVQSDPVNKVTSLWPASTRPQEVEEVLQKAIEATPVDRALMDKITSKLAAIEFPPGFKFGHAADWAPRQVALTAEMFTVKELKKLFLYYRQGTNGIDEGVRGYVIWLIAQSEEEKLDLRKAAQGVLDAALESIDHPLPVVVVLPKQATPGLVSAARRVKALEDLSRSEREKIGTMMYQQEQGLAAVNFDQSVNDLAGDTKNYADMPHSLHEYAIPSVYRTSVQALRNLSLKSVVGDCYRQAYAHRIEFYTQYAVGGKGPNQLRGATQKVALWLFSDTAGSSIPNLGNRDIQHQLSTFYLTQKWGLLTPETYAIRAPTSLALLQAWDFLENTFKPGSKEIPVRQAMLALLNPPYGHDYNTLTLLLAAWIGYHQYEIRFSLSGRVVSLSQLKEYFDEAKSMQDFLNRICIQASLAISRSKPDEVFGQLHAVLEQIRQGKPFSAAEASGALAKFEQALANPRLPDTRREEIDQLQPRLEEALAQAQEYEQKAAQWLDELSAGDLDDLLRLQDGWKNLTAPSLVLVTQPSPEELQNRWESALHTVLNKFCEKYASLTDLADFKSHEERLKRVQKSLADYPAFAEKAKQALEKLSQRRAELKKQEGEKTIVAQINGMTLSAGLKDLYAYQEALEKLTDLTPQTARVRDDKQRQIVMRIRQYEQIAEALPAAVEGATSLSALREQHNLLLRNLESMQETPQHATLLDVQKRVTHLETYFERLQALDHLPRATPPDLDAVEAQIEEIEKQFNEWLSQAQRNLLEAKRDELKRLRHRKTAEARDWLQKLAQRYKDSNNPTALLREMESPPVFLDAESLARLAQIKQHLQKRLDDDLVAQIEDRFARIKDDETRRQCLKRLHDLMGE